MWYTKLLSYVCIYRKPIPILIPILEILKDKFGSLRLSFCTSVECTVVYFFILATKKFHRIAYTDYTDMTHGFLAECRTQNFIISGHRRRPVANATLFQSSLCLPGFRSSAFQSCRSLCFSHGIIHHCCHQSSQT